ncbi:hypothetical protein PR048_016824 [Dryococelus australis]|uniref:Uncharacterized protein n=1 Tax=Dryococelus australis TaxID=614101 RepID=A0ABQ9H7U3_9NEOP|nr:hypothetical protein PR048_016824 [Dryococelus australis]
MRVKRGEYGAARKSAGPAVSPGSRTRFALVGASQSTRASYKLPTARAIAKPQNVTVTIGSLKSTSNMLDEPSVSWVRDTARRGRVRPEHLRRKSSELLEGSDDLLGLAQECAGCGVCPRVSTFIESCTPRRKRGSMNTRNSFTKTGDGFMSSSTRGVKNIVASIMNRLERLAEERSRCRVITRCGCQKRFMGDCPRQLCKAYLRTPALLRPMKSSRYRSKALLEPHRPYEQGARYFGRCTVLTYATKSRYFCEMLHSGSCSCSTDVETFELSLHTVLGAAQGGTQKTAKPRLAKLPTSCYVRRDEVMRGWYHVAATSHHDIFCARGRCHFLNPPFRRWGELFYPDRDSSSTDILSPPPPPPSPPVSPPPPEQTRDRDSHESARATRRRRARTQLTSLSAGPPWIVVRLPTFHPGEPGTIPGGVAPGFSHAGIVQEDAAGRRVFSVISRIPRYCITALLHTHLASSSLVPKTSMFRSQTSSFIHS